MEERHLTINDIASKYNVSKSTVRRWIRNGKLSGQKAGAQWRFDPATVTAAFEMGLLSGTNRVSVSHDRTYESISSLEWAKPLFSLWSQFLEDCIKNLQPDHVIVNDRRGAKIWSLVMRNRYSWGSNLWHSMATELMTENELQQVFGRRRVLLFDEMMQHGREIHELRQRLESKDIDASVTTVTCVRRRSHSESGELLEYKAIACEDVDDRQFMERAAAISRIVHAFEPPLDVDHLVVRGKLTREMNGEEFLEKLSKWGVPFPVWLPDQDHSFMSITLDRPQFFDTNNLPLPLGFSLSWEGPFKIRFYIDPQTNQCDCSFITYPDIAASVENWIDAWATTQKVGQDASRSWDLAFLPSNGDEQRFRRVYWDICMEMAITLLNDFITSGAVDDLGIHLTNSYTALDEGQIRATFGRQRGDLISKRAREILSHAIRGKSLFAQIAKIPPPILIREDSDEGIRCDMVECRKAVLQKIPPRYLPEDSSGKQLQPISYSELIFGLQDYPEAAIGRILDNELDRGTVKPLVELNWETKDGTRMLRMSRAYCRGEFGVWFEWNRNVFTHQDMVIQRTLGFGPTIVDSYLKKIGQSQMTATNFNKTFVNVQHDLRENAHDLLFVAWKPYKYGPIPVVDINTVSGDLLGFADYLVKTECLTENRERHGTQIWRRYIAKSDSEVPWAKLYKERTSAVTKAHLSGLIRLYAAIQQKCKTERPITPRSTTSSEFSDPLVVLATARNARVAYVCGWFEVNDWRETGEKLLFPMLNGHALSGERPTKPPFTSMLRAFAEPPRLLYDKIEMYRNLPYLRQQIEALISTDELDAGEVLLETVDPNPIFESHSKYPIMNLEWACGVMRAFSSFTRQITTLCGLDIDERRDNEKIDENGLPKDANFYLNELMDSAPEIRTLENELSACISEVSSGILTEKIAETLSITFNFILKLFDSEQRIPDPRPQYDRDRDRMETRGGLVTMLRTIQMPEPHGVSVSDIKNLSGLPSFGEIIGIPYDEALDNLLKWVEQEAKDIEKKHPRVLSAGFPADNIILAGPTADEVFISTLDMIKQMNHHLADIDREIISPFGLLRVGIAWKQEALGDAFKGARPGLIAHDIGDKSGRERGSISVTEAFFTRLSDIYKNEFKETEEMTEQGRVFVRYWNPKTDI